MKVKEAKSRKILMIHAEMSVREAAHVMKQANVGMLPVTEQGVLRGVITDRDLALAVLAEGRVPDKTNAGSIMSSPPLTIRDDDDLGEALNLMMRNAVSRLVVLGKRGNVIGVISYSDIALIQEGASDPGEVLRTLAHRDGALDQREREALGVYKRPTSRAKLL